MKLITSIVLTAAVVGASLFTATSAKARPSRILIWTGDDGTDYTVAPVGSNSVELIVDDKFNRSGFIAVRNCGSGRIRWRANTGFSRDQIAYMTKVACEI